MDAAFDLIEIHDHSSELFLRSEFSKKIYNDDKIRCFCDQSSTYSYSWVIQQSSKVRSEIKETTFWDGHFRTLSGHSVANYIIIFHKTKVPTVILRYLLSLNLNWIKSSDINSYVSWQLCFSILEEKKVTKIAIFQPFVVIFWQLHGYLSQNWDSDGHFEVFSVSKS